MSETRKKLYLETNAITLTAQEDTMKPKKGDLVKAVLNTGHLSDEAVVVDRVYSWATMDDAYIIQFSNARRIHVARDQIRVMTEK